jgi:PKD repeat protein
MHKSKKTAFILLILLSATLAVPLAHAVTVPINGTVKDSAGTPISGASVGLYKKQEDGGRLIYIFVFPIATTTTSSTGTFSFTQELTSGETYYVSTSKTGYKSGYQEYTVPTMWFIGFPPRWFPAVTMNHLPIVNHHGPYIGQATVPIEFNSFGSEDTDGSIVSYLWTFGDGGTSTATNPTHAYALNGNYDVTLKITDDDGDSTTEPTYANIGNAPIPPIAEANGPYEGRAPDGIAFSSAGSNDPDGSITGYLWDFGDGGTSTVANPTHAYGEGGTYNITLTVTDNQAMTDSDTTVCEVAPPPVPPIAIINGPYSGRATVGIQFNSSGSDDPDGALDGFLWDFGDGETSNESNPTHAYASEGDYNVSLTVWDNEGIESNKATTVSVGPAPVSPTADANGPYSGRATEEISFSSSGSNDPDGSITGYLWDFGDGGTSTAANPTHTYASEGDYTVTLTVTDNDELTGTDTSPCNVAPAPEPPVAFANGPYEVTVGSAVSFSSAGSTDADGTIVAYSWDFGDGSTSTEPNPSHTYAATGDYTVSLTVTDNDDLTDTNTASAKITEEPFPWMLVIGGLVVVAGAGAFFFMQRKPTEKPPSPAALRVKANPNELPADGRSTLMVTVELLDDKGTPIASEGTVQVNISATLGQVASSVTIGAGMAMTNTTMTASSSSGSSTITVSTTGLSGDSTTVTFTEKKRYCMHCGAAMAVGDNVCPKCGLSPPSGVDVKACPNCGEVIPNVANYCSECGARQPDKEE